MPARPIAISQAGLVCGVGLNAPSACAAIRCAISNFTETHALDLGGAPLIGSAVPLEKPWRGSVRLAKMLHSAIFECLDGVDVPSGSLPMLLCLAERDRPGRPANLANEVIDELRELLGYDFHPSQSVVIEEGRAGAALALARARNMLFEGGYDRVLIAGVDSFLERRALRAYEKRDRLRTSVNSNGFIPGEAASAVLVSAPSGSDEDLLCVGLGHAVEQATVEGEQPCRAEGMTAAIKAALEEADCQMADLDFRITDNSGEQYYFKEAAVALARTLRVRKEEFDIWHPADCIGEVGAAIGPALLAVALFAARKGYAPGMNMLCCMGNDAGRRASAVLRYPGAA
jgi:3-oxoacyl-[acyl-carrier-protein] synthase-1